MINYINSFDIVTVFILIIVFLPLIIGSLFKVSKSSIWVSLVSVLRLIELALSTAIGYFLIKILFFDKQIQLFQNIKRIIFENSNSVIDKNITIYILFMPLVSSLLYLVFRIITKKFEEGLCVTITEGLFNILNSIWGPLRFLIRVIFKVPKALLNIFIICLILAVYDLYLPASFISDQIEQSSLYNLVHQYSIEPILKSSYVQKLPVLFNQTLAQFDKSSVSVDGADGDKLPDRLNNGTKIIWYFNGVTLDEAVKSNEAIDNFARELVGDEMDSKKKARKLYRWVGTHIKYDYYKAELVSNSDTRMPSGAINTFNTRKGICFDYSSLYVAMSRAVGLKVRLITGMGFDGSSWGEHAWNQVYIPSDNEWVNVDTTFAIGGNYFDRPGFDADHKADRIAGEW